MYLVYFFCSSRKTLSDLVNKNIITQIMIYLTDTRSIPIHSVCVVHTLADKSIGPVWELLRNTECLPHSRSAPTAVSAFQQDH